MASLWDAFKQYLGDAAPGGALNPEVTPQGLLDVAALASMPVPVLGDAIGVGADLKRMYDNPDERTLLNTGLLALGALPLVPSGLSAASKALDKAGDASRTKTKYEIAHEIAQRNAALPVEKGGLGLPQDNTAMDRARAMGFDKDAYHATHADFAEFKPNKWRGASYMADDPNKAIVGATAGSGELAFSKPNPTHIMPVKIRGKVLGVDDLPDSLLPRQTTYGQYKRWLEGGDLPDPNALELTSEQKSYLRAMQRDAARNYVEGVPESEQIKYAIFDKHGLAIDSTDDLPLVRGPQKNSFMSYQDVEGIGPDPWVPSSKIPREDIRDLWQKIGYGSVRVFDEAGPGYAVLNPKNIRSRFAAFDPMKRDSSDLLAGVGVPILSGGLLALLMGGEDAQAGQ